MKYIRKLLIAIPCLTLSASTAGCGLDGIRGEVVRMTGNHYVLREPSGKELTFRVDIYTHTDPVNGIDPSGHFRLAELSIAQRIGLFVSVAAVSGAVSRGSDFRLLVGAANGLWF